MFARPAITMDGKVKKIINSLDPRTPDKAEISIEGANELYREIRIENTLTDDWCNQVQLKQGAHVDVTIKVESSETTCKTN